MFDGEGIFVWLGGILLGSILFSILGFIGSRMLQVGQRQKDKKIMLDQEEYGIEVAESMRRRQRIKDKLISLVIIVVVLSIVVWLLNR